MNKHQYTICESLRSMSSAEAATWLLNEYKLENDNWGEVTQVITHRSWLKDDQLRLAGYYLKNIPYASSKSYEAFLTFMSISNFTKIIKKHMPESKPEKELLGYYLIPHLKKKAVSEKDNKIVKELEGLISRE